MQNKVVLIGIPCLLTGGSEYQTLNLVRALKYHGYSVVTACYFEYEPEMVAQFEKNGSVVELLSKEKTIRPKKLKLIRFLYNNFSSLIKQYRPQVVHVQYFAPGTLPILLFRLLGVKKIIATLHTPADVFRKRKFIPRTIGNHVTNLFLTVSKSIEEDLFKTEAHLFDVSEFEKGRKHFTLYNCIDLKDIEVLVKASSSAFPTITCVSRLREEKGVDTLIFAFQDVVKEFPSAELKIMGDGEDRSKLENLSKNLGIAGNVHFMGTGTKTDVYQLFLQSDLAIVPSRFEGFGLTALEAMACGIPVIASDVDGLKEVIRNGKDGILVPPGNNKSLGLAIIALLSDKISSLTIGKNAKKSAAENFSFNKFSDTVHTIYETLLKNKWN